MLNLLIKDVLINRKTILSTIIYNVLMIISFQGSPDVAVVAAVTASTYLLLNTSLAWDDKNKSEIMLNSLPLRRRDIVLAKYLTAIVFYVTGLILYTAVVGIIRWADFPVATSWLQWEGLLSVSVSVGLMAAVVLPLYFKLGYHRSRIVNIIVLVAVILIPAALLQVLSEYHPSFAAFLQSFTDQNAVRLISGGLIMFLAVSCALSLKMYLRKDI